MSEFSALPVEIKRCILSELNTNDLKEICNVSKSLCSIATPILYSTVRLKPHRTSGIETYQKDSLFNDERPNPRLGHIRNLQVVPPWTGRGLTSTSVRYIDSHIQPKLKDNRLLSLSLSSALRSGPDILPFLTRNTQLRAVSLNVPPLSQDAEWFNYLATNHHGLRTLSLQFLEILAREEDIATLTKLLRQSKTLHSLDLKFREPTYQPDPNPTPWASGLELLDTIFGMASLRELSLLGNSIPLGYWAEANPGKRVGKGLTLFRAEGVDRGELDGQMCARDDMFWFHSLDISTLKCLSLCLGVIYTAESNTSQHARYFERNNELRRMLTECGPLEAFRSCNLPQLTEFNPLDHCFFRVKDTLRKLRLCCSDWFGMEPFEGYLTHESHSAAERDIIAELKSLQILELTVNWLEWHISSESIQLVYILREPRFDPSAYDSADEDIEDLDAFLRAPARDVFLQVRAQQFAKLTQQTMLPSLKIVMFGKTNYFRDHCHTMRFDGEQGDRQEYPVLAYLVEREEDTDLPYGVAEPITFREMEVQYPWLYNGTWERKVWDETRNYRFW
ncbi:hypothetical protein TWF730_006272 [Orbilia blumenaviensis]|uniref:F-box domain-containing protein n=1 Tax=Orbilia blumenaviensis TaxID=1796055 RepID=A0AAV9VGF4_9PEZI